MPGFPLSHKSPTDTVDARKACSGDSHAWSRIVERYSPYINALLVSARVPPDDRPDAFQYVFVELFRALPSLRSVDYLAPWIRQTTIRHAVRVRNRAQRFEPLVNDVVDLDSDAQSEVEKAEARHNVREAIASLSAKCRELIHRLFFSETPEPYAEVASALGLSPKSMTVTRHRCLEALERELTARGLG
ncbi:MAG: sigma-70 family RNA polymerase sigma factor [Fimbriimonadaceae bacterium]